MTNKTLKNLNNTAWKWVDTPKIETSLYNITFGSGGETFKTLKLSNSSIFYGDTCVYENGQWANDNFKQLAFFSGTDCQSMSLINAVTSNSQQINIYTLNLKEIENFLTIIENLDIGEVPVTIKSKKPTFKTSPESYLAWFSVYGTFFNETSLLNCRIDSYTKKYVYGDGIHFIFYAEDGYTFNGTNIQDNFSLEYYESQESIYLEDEWWNISDDGRSVSVNIPENKIENSICVKKVLAVEQE